MAYNHRRKTKTDHRQFSDIYKKEDKEYYGEARFFKKKKPCIRCKKLFVYHHGKQLYCEQCQKKS